jgi:hypothetical protein
VVRINFRIVIQLLIAGFAREYAFIHAAALWGYVKWHQAVFGSTQFAFRITPFVQFTF